jgi:hypothetical protein
METTLESTPEYTMPPSLYSQLEKGERTSTIVFTSWTDELETERVLNKYASWFLYGREICPTTGRTHLQGMASSSKSAIRWTDMIGNPNYWTAKCKDPIASIAYCSKSFKKGGSITEKGIRPVFELSKRTTIRFRAKDYKDMSEEQMEELDGSQYLTAKKVKKEQAKMVKKVASPFPEQFYPWQEKLLKDTAQHTPRRIIFIVDLKGNSGKTVFSGWLGTQPGYDYLSIGKKEDILFSAEISSHTFLMDVARSEVAYINYALLEKLKDGYWVVGKYEGKRSTGGKKNLVVLMNSFPDSSKLSEDRYEVYTMASDKSLSYVPYESIPDPS